MKTKSCQFIASATLGLLFAEFAGCAGPQAVPLLPPVSPISAELPARSSGYLIVNSAVEQPEPLIYFDTRFSPHTGYSIYNSRGVLVRTVRNHVGAWDETPDQVSLPSGRYMVHALSEVDGEVAVPVIIQPSRTTIVNLRRHEHSLARL